MHLEHTPTSKRGIMHIDDIALGINDFVTIIKNIDTFTITEKVDGSNLKFGLDEFGKFFTSRIGKGGNKYYSVDDWGNDFKDIGFKFAHQALLKKLSVIKKCGLCKNSLIEIEVLYGNKPNAIPYKPNQIIFLKVIDGNINLNVLANTMEKDHVQIKIDNIPYTANGITIDYRTEVNEWTFAKVKQYSFDFNYIKNKTEPHCNNMMNILKKTIEDDNVITVSEILVSKKHKHRELKKKYKEQLHDLRMVVKDILLDELVRTQHSTLGPSVEEGGWIEGVVIDNGEYIFKIVDKEIFTAVNIFNHKTRYSLTAKQYGPDSADDKAGILGNLLRDLARCLNHTELGTNQAKRYLNTLKNNGLIDTLYDFNFDLTKIKWSILIDDAILKNHNMLLTYKNEYQEYQFIDSTNRKHKYDEVINYRTLCTFAILKRELLKLKSQVDNASNGQELVNILVWDKM